MNVFLKNADFRRFSVASFLSGAGDILFYLAFMSYASKLQNYSLALSLIAISESVPKLFEIFGGYLADKKFTTTMIKTKFHCDILVINNNPTKPYKMNRTNAAKKILRN